MDGDGHKLVCVEGSSKVDWLSSLPESLLYKVLLNLPTKDVVKCSLLSKRWRNLWKYVPGLELDEDNFPDFETFASFVDAFLGFNSESYLESFKLNYCDKNSVRYNWNAGSGVYEPEVGIVTRCWINTVFDRRVKHVVVVDYAVVDCDVWDVQMPPKFYTCESLVSLKLHGVILASPMFVCLPCLKFMDLTLVQAPHDLDLEKLISGCPVLESLFIEKSLSDGIQVLRVCSQSLLRFTLFFNDIGEYLFERDLVVAINAPSLQYLRLGDDRIGSFILNNMSSLVEAYIDTDFQWMSFRNNLKNDLQKRKMIRSFLEGISCVKDMTITSKTHEILYLYSICEQLPLFHNLSFLHVSFYDIRLKELNIFLESCPNLKSLVLRWELLNACSEPVGLSMLSVPRCLLSSLEFVDIKTPLTLSNKTRVRKLASYFLENSETLKKLTVRLNASIKTEESAAIVKKLLAIPRLSSSCQVIVL